MEVQSSMVMEEGRVEGKNIFVICMSNNLLIAQGDFVQEE
jgi:hypothetical protein